MIVLITTKWSQRFDFEKTSLKGIWRDGNSGQ